jgi:glycopeptide antibiotics resistance protein
VRSLSKTVLALYLLVLLWLILFKFSFNLSSLLDCPTRNFNLIPFAHASRDNLRETIYNLAVFIPFGLLLGVNLKRASFWLRLACVVTFSLAVEAVQFVFAMGAADTTDVITNTFGGFLGLMLYRFGDKHVDTDQLDRFIVVAGTVLLVLFVLVRSAVLRSNVRCQSAH